MKLDIIGSVASGKTSNNQEDGVILLQCMADRAMHCCTFRDEEKIKLPARLLFFLPGIICISLATSYLLYDGSASASDPTLLWLYDKGGINVIWGDPLNAMDSINCTVAIYDADEDILYVFEEDT